MVSMLTEKRKASFRMATTSDASLPTYDNTKLSALNTCPTYGILRYQMHKRMPAAGRSMALECGTAMHDVFAWVRLCTLLRQHTGASTQRGYELYQANGIRLFGHDRFDAINEAIIKSHPDPVAVIDGCKRGAITVLDTSGYYDDPRDKRRTLTNMEDCALAYIDRWRWDQPVWVRGGHPPNMDVGIEIPFDMVVSIGPTGDHEPDVEFRLTGKIDGIHVHSNGVVTLHENKTASRLNDAWEMSFALASQVTGYCVAASVFTQHIVDRADIIGLSIPLPKSYDYGGYLRTSVQRHDYHYERWINWLVHTIQLYDVYTNNPYDAPKYTHSCNRYFRPCQFIPFCDSDDVEQHRMVEEFDHDEWSPLHRVDGSQVEEG